MDDVTADIERVRQALPQVMAVLCRIPDPALRDVYTQEAAQMLGIGAGGLAREVEKALTRRLP